MNYDEVKSSLLRNADRRKYFQEQLANTGQKPQMVGDRIAPASGLSSLARIAKLLIDKQGMDAADKKETELNEELTQGREKAFQNVWDTYSGRDEVLDVADMTTPEMEGGVAADPVKAAMMARSDPYLKDSGIGSMIMPDSGRGSFSTYVDYTDPVTGETRKASFNSRAAPGMQLTELDGTPISTKGLSTKDISLVAEGAGKKQFATDIAKREAEKITERPQKEASMSSSEAKTGMLGDLFTQARKQSNGFTTGIVSKATGWIPQTPAYDLNSTLATIKANIGFDRLQEMRDNSKTGGALGQVSERENTLLQQVWGDLDASTSKEQFDKNLSRVQKQVEDSWKRVKKAYKDDYGVDYESTDGSAATSTAPVTQTPTVLKFDANGNLVQ